MIVSHRFRFIFIKTRKTAGTSIELALRPHLGPDDVATPIREDQGAPGAQNWQRPFSSYTLYDWRRFLLDGKRQDFKNHLPGPRIRQMVPRSVWDNYYKFCVERDPFDKTVSAYYWAMSERERQGKPTMSLDDFVYSDLVKEYSDWHRYADNPYEPIVDRVINYKYLDAGLAEVCERVGLPRVTLPRAKSTQRKDKRDAVDLLGMQAMLYLEDEVFPCECEALFP